MIVAMFSVHLILAQVFSSVTARACYGYTVMMRSTAELRIRLGKHLHELRKLQWGTLASQEDLETFRTLPLESV